jgi:hypothetical protein
MSQWDPVLMQSHKNSNASRCRTHSLLSQQCTDFGSHVFDMVGHQNSQRANSNAAHLIVDCMLFVIVVFVILAHTGFFVLFFVFVRSGVIVLFDVALQAIRTICIAGA